MECTPVPTAINVITNFCSIINGINMKVEKTWKAIKHLKVETAEILLKITEIYVKKPV